MIGTKGKGYMKTNQQQLYENGGVYEVKIKGILDEHWDQWFDGMTLRRVKTDEAGKECTIISGPITDQPALHGLLAKIRDLNLTLISVYRINSETNKWEETPIDLPPNQGGEKR